MKQTRYSGYTSYSYLEAGTDYRPFTHGYGDDDIAKILGGNTRRVPREVWWR